MAVVIHFDKEIKIFHVSKSMSKYTSVLVMTLINDKANGIFINENNLEDILRNLLSKYPDWKREKFSFVLTSMSGIIYNTVRIGNEKLKELINEENRDTKDKDAAYNKALLQLMPKGVRIKDYFSSLIYESNLGEEKTLSLAFIKKAYVDNIYRACFNLGVSVLNITSFAYALFNSFDDLGRQIIFDTGYSYMCINHEGCLVWQKPKTDFVGYAENDVQMYFVDESEKVFSLDDAGSITSIVNKDLGDYYLGAVNIDGDISIDGIGAIGAVMPFKFKAIGGDSDVFSSLREFFEQ